MSRSCLNRLISLCRLAPPGSPSRITVYVSPPVAGTADAPTQPKETVFSLLDGYVVGTGR